jgi:hypothetical protein
VKKTYDTPHLVRYGSVAEITLRGNKKRRRRRRRRGPYVGPYPGGHPDTRS